MTKYILISEEGYLSHVTANDYRDMQRHVGGLITTPWEGRKLDGMATIIANDEAILLGMQHNNVASFITGHPLFGPVLVGGPTDDEGNILDVTDEVVNMIDTMHHQSRVAVA
jgi:hypothetical protein